MAAVGTRSFWLYATQEVAKPYVVIRLASERTLGLSMDGTAIGPAESTVEVLCIANNQSSAWVVADAVKSDLHNRRGLTPSSGTVNLKRCICTDRSDLVSEENFERGNFGVSLTFTIAV